MASWFWPLLSFCQATQPYCVVNVLRGLWKGCMTALLAGEIGCEGGSAQEPRFSIPFSGQSGLFAEDEDDLFGAGISQQPGPFGSGSLPSGAVVSEPSFSFDDVTQLQEESQTVPGASALAAADVSNNCATYEASYADQQQQKPYQAAIWPGSQSQPKSQFQPWSQSPSQPEPQLPSQLQSQSTPLFQLQSQSQSQSQPQSQGNLFQPVRQQSYHQSAGQAPQLFMPHSSASQTTLPPVPDEFPSVPPLPFQQIPSVPLSLPFQQQPQAQAFGQQAYQFPGGPLAVNTQRVSSPYAVDNNHHAQPDQYGEDSEAILQQQGTSIWSNQGRMGGSPLKADSVVQQCDVFTHWQTLF